jgi:hypothetical protein
MPPSFSSTLTPDELYQRRSALLVWLHALTLTPVPASAADDATFDLVSHLRSGVLLCQAMLAVSEFSIDSYIAHPTHSYQMELNVSQFCAAARDLGVPSLLLVRVADFSSNAPTNESRIVRCLWTLAELVMASPAYSGPPLVVPQADHSLADVMNRRLAPSLSSSRRTASHRRHPSSQLSSTSVSSAVTADATAVAAVTAGAAVAVASTPDAASDAPAAVVAGESAATTAEQRVAERLKQLTASDLARVVMCIRRLQLAVRAARVRREEQQRQRAQTFRSRVANEILLSEREYAKALEECARVYLKTLKKAVTKEQVSEIFSPVFETIVLLSRTLLSDLEQRMLTWAPEQALGDVFVKIIDFLKVYVGYIENFDTSIRTRTELGKSKKFGKLLESCVADGNVQALASYLIMPVQRLPRYIMLLRELHKYTPATHADAPLLAQAIDKVSAVTEFVNEKKRTAEQLMLLLALEHAIKADASRWSAFAQRGRSLTKLGVAECLSLAPSLECGECADVALLLCDDVVMLVKGNLDALQDIARSADAVRFGRRSQKGAALSAATVFGGGGSTVCSCVLQRGTRTVDLRAAPADGGTAVTNRDVELFGVSGEILATLRCAHVAERDAWISVFQKTRRHLVEQSALMQLVMPDSQSMLQSERKSATVKAAAAAAATTTGTGSRMSRGLSFLASKADLATSPSRSAAGVPTSVMPAADTLQMLTLARKNKRVSTDLSKLKQARARLDSASQQMAALRSQVEAIEVQLIFDDQQHKGKKMKKAQRQNLERIVASMRADLDEVIADVDVLSEHVAQLARAIDEATRAAPSAVPPAAASPTAAAAAAAADDDLKAGALLERRASLVRNRSRRRSAEAVPPPATAAAGAPNVARRMVRRSAEKHLRVSTPTPSVSAAAADADAAAAVDAAVLGASSSPPSLAPPTPKVAPPPSPSKPPPPSRPAPSKLSSEKEDSDSENPYSSTDSED